MYMSQKTASTSVWLFHGSYSSVQNKQNISCEKREATMVLWSFL